MMKLQDLPAVGHPLDGGIFAGLTATKDDTHCAVVLLPAAGTDLTWKKAKTWAEEQGGELPSRSVATLLFVNCKPHLQPRWHWTADELDASYAWDCLFYNGDRATVARATKVTLLPSA